FQFDESVHDRLRARRAAREKEVDGNRVLQGERNRSYIFRFFGTDSAKRSATSQGEHETRVSHARINFSDFTENGLVQICLNDEDIRELWILYDRDSETFDVVPTGDRSQPLIGTASGRNRIHRKGFRADSS